LSSASNVSIGDPITVCISTDTSSNKHEARVAESFILTVSGGVRSGGEAVRVEMSLEVKTAVILGSAAQISSRGRRSGCITDISKEIQFILHFQPPLSSNSFEHIILKFRHCGTSVIFVCSQ
jgi:hypothetical protein